VGGHQDLIVNAEKEFSSCWEFTEISEESPNDDSDVLRVFGKLFNCVQVVHLEETLKQIIDLLDNHLLYLFFETSDTEEINKSQ
jgi:hypothetical protein